ncbi:MAG: LacI family DNA-binding transcriptional regulator [Lachnospiraceae bacterium]|nr:LacI family DNA-binding transcriptional regulator [Lachnospiraceae bacterium]
MTIKDIAKLASVSTSTVSKIMNNKDSHINENTRQRVLSIIKEYNYKPYANIRDNTANTFTLGVVFSGKSACMDSDILLGISSYAQTHGYASFVLYSTGSADENLKCLSLLASRNVSGIIWKIHFPEKGSFSEEEKLEHLHSILDDSLIPYIILSDLKSGYSMSIDYEYLGYQLTKQLISMHHTEIGCLIQGRDARSRAVVSGFKRCLTEHGLLCQNTDIILKSELSPLIPETLQKHTALLSSHYSLTLSLYALLQQNKFSIPDDISIVSILEDPEGLISYPQITGIRLPGKLFGEYICSHMITLYETGSFPAVSPKEELLFNAYHTLTAPVTLSTPVSYRQHAILCVGTINYDCTIISDHFPKSGSTLMATSSSYSLGGKGANQAVGAARLGQKVILIGKIGDDTNSIQILDLLNQFGVLTHAVSREKGTESGKAYIQLESNGDSTITVVPGANKYLSPEYILSCENEFRHAGYCMISGEMRPETVVETCRLGRKYGVKTIFKPAGVSFLPDELYPLADIFVPNHAEAALLSGIENDTKGQAEFFIQKGAACVIITLGSDGCYLQTPAISVHYPACRFFSVVDNTGAADAFIGALTSYLSMGYSIEDSISIAQIAAAFSVSRVGCASAAIDKVTLENYLNMKGSAITIS